MGVRLFIFLLPLVAIGATVTTYDTRFAIDPVESQYRAVDVADTSKITNPNYTPMLRAYRVPALIDTDLRLGVTITGTVEQAEADLLIAISNSLPATAALRGKSMRDEAREVRRNLTGNGQLQDRVRSLEAEVARLSIIVEAMLEQQE